MSTTQLQLSKAPSAQDDHDDVTTEVKAASPGVTDTSPKAKNEGRRQRQSRRPNQNAKKPEKAEKAEDNEPGKTNLLLFSNKNFYLYLNLVKTLLHTKYETVQVRGINDHGNNQVARVVSLLKKLGYVDIESFGTHHRPKQHSLAVTIKKTAEFATLFEAHQAVADERREKRRTEREAKDLADKEMASNSQSDEKDEVKTEVKTEVQTEVKTEVDAEVKTEVKTDVDAEAEAQAVDAEKIVESLI